MWIVSQFLKKQKTKKQNQKHLPKKKKTDEEQSNWNLLSPLNNVVVKAISKNFQPQGFS